MCNEKKIIRNINRKRALFIPNHNGGDVLTLYRKVVLIVCMSMRLVNRCRCNLYLIKNKKSAFLYALLVR